MPNSYPPGKVLLQSYKAGFGERWQNNYLLNFTSVALAADIASAIVTKELLFHSNGVRFTYYRLSTTTPNDRQFRTVALQANGSFNQTTDLLPFVDCAEAVFTTEDSYPGRKFYHGCLQESDQVAGELTTAAIVRFNNVFADLVTAAAGTLIVGNPAKVVTAASVNLKTGYHQPSKRSRYPRGA